MGDYTTYIATAIGSGITLGLAFVATAFGYGRLNQIVDDQKEKVKEDISEIKTSFDKFIDTNRQEHEVIFGEFRKVTKHMGAVETYMEMAEKRRNGKTDK